MVDPHLPFFQSSLLVLFACYGKGSVPVLLLVQSGPPWAWVESDQAYSRHAIALNSREISLCCPMRSFHFWMEPAARWEVSPQPTAGCSRTSVCRSFPILRSGVHIWEVLDLWGFLGGYDSYYFSFVYRVMELHNSTFIILDISVGKGNMLWHLFGMQDKYISCKLQTINKLKSYINYFSHLNYSLNGYKY